MLTPTSGGTGVLVKEPDMSWCVLCRSAVCVPLFVISAPVMGSVPVGPQTPSAFVPQQTLRTDGPQFTNNIMLTGYWPPTGDMIRRFSANSAQNPAGWAGGNWEGSGYDIYSYFPEFPSGAGVNSRGTGDFEIDYQDTSRDWQRIVEEVRPIAIITLSWDTGRTQFNHQDWELEMRHRNRTTWTDDYNEPKQPTNNPMDSSIEPNGIRYSSLPMLDIANAVNSANVGVRSYIDDFSPNFGGSFLSEYIGYHGVWWHDMHNEPFSENWNIAAGHVHVGSEVSVESGMLATDITLRTLTAYLDSVLGLSNKLTGGMNPLLGDAPQSLDQLRSTYANIPAPGAGVTLLALSGFGITRRRR